MSWANGNNAVLCKDILAFPSVLSYLERSHSWGSLKAIATLLSTGMTPCWVLSMFSNARTYMHVLWCVRIFYHTSQKCGHCPFVDAAQSALFVQWTGNVQWATVFRRSAGSCLDLREGRWKSETVSCCVEMIAHFTMNKTSPLPKPL